ncbi:hypothetical protein ACOSQ2_024427 [Xanthoceras sorbifolium]
MKGSLLSSQAPCAHAIFLTALSPNEYLKLAVYTRNFSRVMVYRSYPGKIHFAFQVSLESKAILLLYSYQPDQVVRSLL